MSYIKNAYLDLSEELGLSPAQLLNVPTKAEILAKWQREVREELTEEEKEMARLDHLSSDEQDSVREEVEEYA